MAKTRKPETVTVELTRPFAGRPKGTRKELDPERAAVLTTLGVAVIVSDGNPAPAVTDLLNTVITRGESAGATIGEG